MSETLYGGHFGKSGSKSVKTIEELEETQGTLEYWESVFERYKNEPNYKHPDKNIEQVGFEIFQLNKCSKRSKRGRIQH